MRCGDSVGDCKHSFQPLESARQVHGQEERLTSTVGWRNRGSFLATSKHDEVQRDVAGPKGRGTNRPIAKRDMIGLSGTRRERLNLKPAGGSS